MMDLEKRVALILKLVEGQHRAVFSVQGVIWDGFVLSCLYGRLNVVARPYGTDEAREDHTWDLGEVNDIGFFEEDADEEEADSLMGTARELAGRAREWDELSLAEQLVRNRIPRGDAST